MTDDDCRAPSLLPGWSRGHVLAHWARNADGQTRMLQAAMRGEVAAQYPGGDAQRAADIETGAARPAPVILQDVRAALDRAEDAWRRMPPRGLVPPDGGLPGVVAATGRSQAARCRNDAARRRAEGRPRFPAAPLRLRCPGLSGYLRGP